jgi:hypothetical protein
MTDPIPQDASENTPPVAIVEAPQDAPASRTYTPADVKIDWTTKWWGFELSLNQAAVELLNDLYDQVNQTLGHFLKEPFKALVTLAVLRKRIRLYNVSKRTGFQGCRMISPWIGPMGLTIVRNKADADLSLYSSVWDSSKNTWGEESAFTDIESATGPALCQFRDRLYCVYRGKGDDTNMYWMHYTSEDGWSDGSEEDGYPPNMQPKKFENNRTTGVPTLVVFNDKLYCFHKGIDQSLYCCTLSSDRTYWTQDFKVNALPDTSGENRYVNTNYGTAAAVFNNKLYLVFPEKTGGYLYQISSDNGIDWSMITPFWGGKDYYRARDIPSLAVYKNKLHLLIPGCDNELWNTETSNGTDWANAIRMQYHHTWEGPALAVFDDKLVMVHRSADKKADLYYATYDGNPNREWSADTRFTEGQVTGDNPALAVYMDPNANAENYVDPSYGGAKLIVAYRGS